MKILIVDNHGAIRRLLKQYIKATIGKDSDVRECKSGDEAISMYPLLKPDCVLMDIELGTMSGFEAITKIMHIDSEARVVIVSSHNSTLYKAKAKELNVRGYVCKDSLHELAPLLQTLIN